MESGVGSVLRKTRGRREIELSEVEAATRIRARFLRAIEDEEWDALPGGVYTRGFIRTYASFLGLDGERLVEDYRREVEGSQGGRAPVGELAPTTAPAATGPSAGRRSQSRLRWLTLPAVVLVGVLAIVAQPDGGGGGEGGVEQKTASQAGLTGDASDSTTAAPRPEGLTVRLSASAEVWVCLLDGAGEPLVDGLILEAGAEEGPFRSGSFTVSFGNGEISMLIDGKQAEIPPTASPIGYSIDSSGQLSELGEAERPTCT